MNICTDIKGEGEIIQIAIVKKQQNISQAQPEGHFENGRLS